MWPLGGFAALVAGALAATASGHFGVRAAIAFAAALGLWLLYVGALSYLGIVADPARRPPGIVFILGPVFLFMMLAVVRSGAALRVALSLPLPVLIGAQFFCVGVELFLHQLWLEGLVPRMLTFEGANVDIWIGLSTPAAWASPRGLWGRRLDLSWSAIGLVALANIAIGSALTAPGRLRLVATEVPNLAVGAFPFHFIADFLAPLAVAPHVLAIRALHAGHCARHPVAVSAA